MKIIGSCRLTVTTVPASFPVSPPGTAFGYLVANPGVRFTLDGTDPVGDGSLDGTDLLSAIYPVYITPAQIATARFIAVGGPFSDLLLVYYAND